MEKRIYRTAMYLRLSKGDGDVDGNIKSESNSTGVLEQGKRAKVSYKVKREIQVPEADWIRVENTHEPIISRHSIREEMLDGIVAGELNRYIHLLLGTLVPLIHRAF